MSKDKDFRPNTSPLWKKYSERPYQLENNDGWAKLLISVIQQAQEDYATFGTSQNKGNKAASLKTATQLLFGKCKYRPEFGELETLLVRNGLPISFANGARGIAEKLREHYNTVGGFGPSPRVEGTTTGPIDFEYINDMKTLKFTRAEVRGINEILNKRKIVRKKKTPSGKPRGRPKKVK